MYWRSLTRVSGPEVEPVTAYDAYSHLRLVEDDSEKDYAEALVAVAREYVEQRNGIATTEQVWEMSLDGWWEDPIAVPYPPLVTIQSVKYTDQDGNEQTLDPANYRVVPGEPVAFLAWSANSVRPAKRDEIGSVRVRFLAGRADPNSVPKSIRQGILLLVGTWFENREGVSMAAAPMKVPFAVDALLDQTRVRW
jgi:uncharacterized phiE125 gp8 family phage protein